jgi:hypothetical protein
LEGAESNTEGLEAAEVRSEKAVTVLGDGVPKGFGGEAEGTVGWVAPAVVVSGWVLSAGFVSVLAL